MSKILKATHSGELDLNGFILSCSVLENGIRVFSERSLANAFGIKGSGAFWKKKKVQNSESAFLPEYLSANYLSDFISNELRKKFNGAFSYISKSKVISKGVEATILPDICDVYIQAQKKIDNKNIDKVASTAYTMIRGFAHVGIIALVDEATGYQLYRDKDALQKFLNKFLLEEHAKWINTYPDEFFEVIFKMKGWTWNYASTKKPSVVGHYINNFVYGRLAPKVLTELKEINPVTEKGHRKYKHTQFISSDYGHPLLKEHLHAIIALAKGAGFNWINFQRLVNRAFPKFGHTLEIGFNDSEIIE